MKFVLPLLLVFMAWSFASLATGYEYEYDNEQDETDSSLPHVTIQSVTDLAALSREARAGGKVIMLEMSASHCGYCRTLEEEIIKPMLRNRDYDTRVLIRKLDIDDYSSMADFNGAQSSPVHIARRYGVFVTPTLLFIDADGKEAAKRILGVNTLEFYGGYVDEALNEAHRKINHPKYVYQTE